LINILEKLRVMLATSTLSAVSVLRALVKILRMKISDKFKVKKINF